MHWLDVIIMTILAGVLTLCDLVGQRRAATCLLARARQRWSRHSRTDLALLGWIFVRHTHNDLDLAAAWALVDEVICALEDISVPDLCEEPEDALSFAETLAAFGRLGGESLDRHGWPRGTLHVLSEFARALELEVDLPAEPEAVAYDDVATVGMQAVNTLRERKRNGRATA